MGEMRRIDTVGMWISVVEMSLLIIVITGVIVHVCRKRAYSFVIVLLVLCLLTNIGTATLATGLALETDPDFHERHSVGLAQLIGCTTFFFNFPTNLLHWTFGWKYYVISIEVPKALRG